MKMFTVSPVVMPQSVVTRSALRGCLIGFVGLLLSGCQHPGAIREDVPSGQTPANASSAETGTGLTSDLLYSILVSDMARDREQSALALDYLIRATDISPDRGLLIQAIELALETKNYQQLVETSRKLLTLEPDNFRIVLIHAEGLFRIGDSESALKLIRDMILEQPLGRLDAFSESADLLLRQENPAVLNEFYTFFESEPSAALSLTAAILSARQQRLWAFSRWIQRTLELAPEWEEAAILKLTLLGSRDMEKAVRYARDRLDIYPDQVDFRIRFAQILLEHSRIEESITQYMAVLNYAPDSEPALLALGALHVEQQETEQARLVFEHALNVNNRSDQARLYLAQIAQEEHDYDTAIKYLRSVSLPEYYLDAQVTLGWIYYELDGIETAIKYLNRVSVHAEEDRVNIIQQQAQMYREEEMFDHTREVLDEALERYPDHPDLLYNRGLLFAQVNLLELHEQDMRTLIEIDPENAHAYNALGYTLADKTDRFDEAMELIVEANRLLPGNAMILDSLGWVYYRLGKMDMALKYLQQALADDQNAEIAAHLGEVLWVIGHHSEAREIWLQGMQWGPENTVLRDTIHRLDLEQSGKLINYADPDNNDPLPASELQSSSLTW